MQGKITTEISYEVTNDWRATTGTGLRGYTKPMSEVAISRILGDPLRDHSGDGKVSVEWIIEFADGEVASVYDYKSPDRDEYINYEWHIGGTTDGYLRALEILS